MSQATDTGLSADQERTLASVLDAIIPESPDGRLPGAGALGLVRHIEEVFRRSPELRPGLEQGLASLDERAGPRGAPRFEALSPADRTEVLNEHAAADPGFLPGLIFHTYTGYYQHPRVVGALGIPPRPPHPEGYEIPENDLSLLDPVRKRLG